MSRLALLLLALVAPSLELAAQDVVPDTTSPARYAPLGVGDVWHYRDVGGLATREFARRVLRDTTINDTTYAVVDVYADLGAFGGDRIVTRTELLRFDSTRAVLRKRDGSREIGAHYAPCAYDAPFPGPSGTAPCLTDGEWTGLVVYGSYEVTFHIGDSVRVGPLKSFDSLGGWASVAADIGIVSSGGDGSVVSTELEYAVVGGRTYGAPIEGLPVPVSSIPNPTAPTLALHAFPSPTAGPLTVTLDLPEPEPVELAVFDAVGRRVWHHELVRSTGRQRVEIDVSAWAPGLYLVRATTGDASSTVTVVRR